MMENLSIEIGKFGLKTASTFCIWFVQMAYGSIGSLTLLGFQGMVLIKNGSSVIKNVSQSGSSEVTRFTKSLWCVKTLAIKWGSNYRHEAAEQDWSMYPNPA